MGNIATGVWGKLSERLRKDEDGQDFLTTLKPMCMSLPSTRSILCWTNSEKIDGSVVTSITL